jgi:hypothetical protein
MHAGRFTVGYSFTLFDQASRMLATRQTNAPLMDEEPRLVIIGGATFGSNTVPGNATGLIGNLTVADRDGDGLLDVYAADEVQIPDTSSINYSGPARRWRIPSSAGCVHSARPSTVAS